MSRAADYAIKGFLYQFNKTLLEVLASSDGSTVTAEGIVEDVEIVTPPTTKAIQCKYHEASSRFTQSSTSKPVLQMMHHFHKNPGGNVHYVLFAHYRGMAKGDEASVDKKALLRRALQSKDEDLQKYVVPLRNQVDLSAFSSRFTLEFGPTFDDLVAQVKDALKKNDIPADDIDTLAYPNAINMIAGVCAKHDLEERQITKLQFLGDLKSIRTTAISHWTLALNTRKQLLDARRKQLKTHLDKNSRFRCFVVDAESFGDHSAEIVLFIRDYLDKYHFKPAHIYPPVFCLRTCEDEFNDIQYRLHEKGVRVAHGVVGKKFVESEFFRAPLLNKAGEREFSVRLLLWNDEDTIDLLNRSKCDDLFILGECDNGYVCKVDVNVEHLAATALREIKYILGVSNAYE